MPGSILSSGDGAGSNRGKLRQVLCCSGAYSLFRGTVNKQVEKCPNRKRSGGDNRQSDMVEAAWRREGGCCSLSGQRRPLGGGDPELRTTKRWPIGEDREALWKL